MTLTYFWAKIIKKIRGSAIKNSTIHFTSKVESGSNILNVEMDRYSFCGYECEISNTKIGSFCSIANNVVIGGGMHPINWVSMSPVFYQGRDSVKAKFSEFEREKIKTTVIGHDVWIGQGAKLKQGVTIGTGAVIGMGSIVTKDVRPYTIVGGNPAKMIRERFNSELAEALLKSEWWNLKDIELQKIAKNIKDPESFLKDLKI